MVLLSLIAIFMILLILIQRGRGGGLVGALGGMGGQSAFGTKAGDLFTRITMWTALVWIVLATATVRVLNWDESIGVTGENAGTSGEVQGTDSSESTSGGAGGSEAAE